MDNHFNFVAKYYDLIYKGKDTDGEVLYVDSLLKQYASKKPSILEFGLGTGRHAKLLINLGYKVHGVERSKKMIKEIYKIKGLEYSIGDIEKISLNVKFDSVISLFHVISYQTTNNKLLGVFKNANKHLNKGGVFIFDIWYSPAVNFIKPSIRVKRFSNKDVEITKIAEPQIYHNSNVVDVNYTFFVEDKTNKQISYFKEKHTMRHFSKPEIEFFASMSGFKLLQCEEWVTRKTPSDDTWGVCFVLEKI